MATHKVISMVQGEPTFKKPLAEILSECEFGGALQVLSPDKYISEQQRAWWKGILLPALAKHTGDSVLHWETVLKLAVMPEKFQPIYIPLQKQVFPIVPSVTILSLNQMGKLMEGSVHHLREDKKYGDEFQWVTLPDPELRSKPKKGLK